MSPRYKRQKETFFLEAVGHAIDHDQNELRLWQVATPSSFGLNNVHGNMKTIIEIAKDWQSEGLGAVRDADKGWPIFAFNKAGLNKGRRRFKQIERKMLLGKMLAVNWSALGALAAIIAAAAAIASAYFSYLSLMKS